MITRRPLIWLNAMMLSVMILLSNMIAANTFTTICSDEGRDAVISMGGQKEKWEKYCLKKSSGKVDYDLVSGAQDFAEIKLDTSTRKAIGKSIRAKLAYCGSPDATNDSVAKKTFPTVGCSLIGGGFILITGAKDVRMILLKNEEGRVIEGKIVGSFGSPIIEIQ